MRTCQIELLGVHLICIKECTIVKKVNAHGYAVIGGIIENEEEENLFKIAESKQFTKLIGIEEMGESKVLFTGIIGNLEIIKEGGLKFAQIKLLSGTRLLEGKLLTRTFQNKNLTYQDLLKMIEKDYTKINHLMHVGSQEKIGDMIVQYKEDNWSFLKRLEVILIVALSLILEKTEFDIILGF